MKKNTAGQKIGAQMTTASDGSNFTGTVTVYVTIDAGTQAIGTVASGVCTHEGNGYHTYAPSQAETNGDLLAFTFIGSGAISVTKERETNTGTASPIKKNTAFSNFVFQMTDSTNHNPATGKTVTATRQIDSGAFASGTISAVTEISSGYYRVDLGAGDLNGDEVTFLFTATGCDDKGITVYPEP